MKERPILFSGEMVRAILDGRKTQTRRILKKQPEKSTWEGLDGYRLDVRFFDDVICGTTRRHSSGVRFANRLHQREDCALWVPCPYGQPGDRLWVKETFCILRDTETREEKTYYRATDDIRDIDIVDGDGFTDERKDGTPRSPWKPSLFMPRTLSRITLEVVSVRVERLQDISEEDAKAEGVILPKIILPGICYRIAYASLWDRINGAGSMNANPYVWVIEFKRVPLLSKGT